jgi:hypothetical protein
MIKKVARCEEPPADVETNPSPSEVFVELACGRCDVKQLRSDLQLASTVVCVPEEGEEGDQDEVRWLRDYQVPDVDACTSCHGKFK